MAYPRYIGKGAFQSGTGALTVPAATGIRAGDIIVIFVESANQAITTPTGYEVLATQIGTGTAAAAGGVRIASYYKIMDDVADTATTINDSGDHTTAIKMVFRDTAFFIGNLYAVATSTQAATTSMVFPAVTTLTDESLVVLAVGQDTDAASTATVGAVTNANLTSITERHDQTVIAGAGGGLAVITGQKATAGSTGTSTATGSTSVTHAYHTISFSRIANQTTSTQFNTVSGANFVPVSDAMRITADATGTVQLASSGTFEPIFLTNGTYGINTKWYYRQLGTDDWSATSSTADINDALVSLGALDTVGNFADNKTVTGLTNGVEYVFALFAARTSATPTNNISFSATATISIPKSITAATGAYTYSGNNANTLYNRRVAAETGAYSYSGNNANTLFNRKVVADTGTYSYSGNNANILFNRDIIAEAGSFTYAGNNATLTYTTALNNYTITADTGSFTYSGNNANVLFNRNIAAETGAYTYSGNAANVLFNRRVIAEAGSYSYSGNAANVLYNRRIAADPASFSYSGNNAGLLFNRKVIADAGSFAYSGNNAGLLYSRILTADAGTYTYSGNNATLTYTTVGGYTLTADAGSFSYSGNNANLTVGFKIVADTGTYSYSGNAANLVTARRVVADTGSFSYAGNNANLLSGKKVIAEAGAFTYSGNAANVVFGRRVAADTGVYTYSGNAANLLTSRKVVADTGAFTYSGNAANLVASRKVIAEAGTFTYSGNAANLLSGRKVAADTGSYSYSGNAASVLYNRKVVADTGSYSYSGNAASILYNRKLIAAVGSFTYSGNAANISFTGAVSKIYFGTLNISNLKYGSFNIYEAYLGSTQVWGKPRPVNAMIAETVAYTYTGNNATLRVGKTLAANGASYSLSGNNSLLKYGRKLVADAASYTYSGNNAVLSKFYTMTRYATIFDDSGNGSSSITAVFNTNGTISFNTSAGDGPVDTNFTHWHDGGTVSGIGNSRWAKRTLLSGDAVAGSLDTTLVALSASKTIAIQTVAGEGKSGEVLIEIYSDSGGTTKVGQITLTITATL